MRTSDRLIETIHDQIRQRGKPPTHLVIGWQVWQDMEIELEAMLHPPPRVHYPEGATRRFHIRGIPGEVSPYLNTRHVVWYVENDLVAVTEVPDPMT